MIFYSPCPTHFLSLLACHTQCTYLCVHLLCSSILFCLRHLPSILTSRFSLLHSLSLLMSKLGFQQNTSPFLFLYLSLISFSSIPNSVEGVVSLSNLVISTVLGTCKNTLLWGLLGWERNPAKGKPCQGRQNIVKHSVHVELSNWGRCSKTDVKWWWKW